MVTDSPILCVVYQLLENEDKDKLDLIINNCNFVWSDIERIIYRAIREKKLNFIHNLFVAYVEKRVPSFEKRIQKIGLMSLLNDEDQEIVNKNCFSNNGRVAIDIIPELTPAYKDYAFVFYDPSQTENYDP